MYTVSNFKFKLNKNRILNTVRSYCPMPPYEDMSKMYDDLINLLKECSKPFGAYKIDEKPDNLNLSVLEKCSKLVYCAVTIGDGSTKMVDSLFAEGSFHKAIILDAMASSYLFDISSQFYLNIFNHTASKKLGLTCKIAPGDGELDLNCQQYIVNCLRNQNIHEIDIVDKYMLYPSKSMSYIYGADKNIPIAMNDHNCDNCPNINCCMRNSSKNIKSSFLKNVDCA